MARRQRREPPPAGAGLATAGGRAPSTRMTWIGLGIVAIGWALQIMGSALAVAAGGGATPPPGIVGISQSLILSGFGMAILDALNNGFGALNRFFETIAQRSAAAAARPAPAPPPPSPTITVPERADPNRIKGRGRIADRPYMQFADGSVEVETLLGSRRFSSFEEARAFIGG